ncbi:MAG: PLP-dependent aminotransferase family protein [Firmicutes bacterium]|nr:PLP-dependent aminotransferase family protein [Bacillota bacterium]
MKKEPSYIQIYNQIKKEIIEGTYEYGKKLPSKRQLAFDTETSVITIEHAYSILLEEGYIESKQRSGYFVAYRDKDWFLNTEVHEESTHIPHVNSVQDTISFSVLSKTMRKVLSEYQEDILMKSPNLGTEELRIAISRYLRRNRNMDISPNQIVIGSGSEYLYSLIVQMLGTNRIYALENPCYEKIQKVYTSNGAHIEMLRMGKDGIQSKALHRTRATVLHVTPYNSFPSGISASVSKRKEYVHFAEERNGYVIEDDYDSEFSRSSKKVDTIYSLEPNKRIIYVNSFSKTIAPSIRVGYMILPKEESHALLKKIDFYSCTVPTFEQFVIAELLNNGDFERHINRLRRKRNQNL